MTSSSAADRCNPDRGDANPSGDGLFVEIQATRILATTARSHAMQAIRALQRKRLSVTLAAVVASLATVALASGTLAGLKIGSAWPMLTTGIFFVTIVWSLLLRDSEHEDDVARMLDVCLVAAEHLGRVTEDGLERPGKAAVLIERFRPQLRRIAAEHAGQEPAEIERLSRSIASSRAQRSRESNAKLFRRYERIVPKRRRAMIRLANGQCAKSRIIDMSQSGVATSTTLPLERGDRARIGSRDAVVVRKLDGGVVLRFVEPIPSDVFTDRYRL